jgi:Rhodopirellula transposase DDE domain
LLGATSVRGFGYRARTGREEECRKALRAKALCVGLAAVASHSRHQRNQCRIDPHRDCRRHAAVRVTIRLPPGTSKWNKIEHRLFSFVTMNWRGKPLRSYRTIVQLIAATTTDTGLTVRAELDERKDPKAVKVTDDLMVTINLFRHSSMVTGTTR